RVDREPHRRERDEVRRGIRDSLHVHEPRGVRRPPRRRRGHPDDAERPASRSDADGARQGQARPGRDPDGAGPQGLGRHAGRGEEETYKIYRDDMTDSEGNKVDLDPMLAFDRQDVEFVSAIREGREPESSAASVVPSMALLDKIDKAMNK